jgi:hypothetical protein
MDQVREVLRLKHYSIRTERSYADWIKRYIHSHRMKMRDDLFAGPDAKIEEFLSDLAVRGQMAASTQNQPFNAAFTALYGVIVTEPELLTPRKKPRTFVNCGRATPENGSDLPVAGLTNLPVRIPPEANLN